MTDLTNFTDLRDVNDAAIEWVIKATGGTDSVENTRIWALEKQMYVSRTRILAARLIQQHRPDLLVDPVDAIVREELAKAYDRTGDTGSAECVRGGSLGGTAITDAAKRLYLMGVEKGKGA